MPAMIAARATAAGAIAATTIAGTGMTVTSRRVEAAPTPTHNPAKVHRAGRSAETAVTTVTRIRTRAAHVPIAATIAGSRTTTTAATRAIMIATTTAAKAAGRTKAAEIAMTGISIPVTAAIIVPAIATKERATITMPKVRTATSTAADATSSTTAIVIPRRARAGNVTNPANKAAPGTMTAAAVRTARVAKAADRIPIASRRAASRARCPPAAVHAGIPAVAAPRVEAPAAAGGTPVLAAAAHPARGAAAVAQVPAAGARRHAAAVNEHDLLRTAVQESLRRRWIVGGASHAFDRSGFPTGVTHPAARSARARTRRRS